MEQNPDDASQTRLCDLWTLLGAVTGPADEHQCARLLATGVPSLFECRLSGTALIDEERATWSWVLLAAGELTEAEAEAPGALLEVMRSGDLSVLRAEDGLPPFAQRAGIASLAAAPILTLRSRIGMLFVGKEEGESFSRDDEFMLRTLSEQFATVIENLRLHQRLERHSEGLQRQVEQRTARLRESEERQRVLLEVNNSLVANLDRASLCEAIAEALGGRFSFDLAALALLDRDGETIRISAIAGSLPEGLHVGDEFPRVESHLGPAIDGKQLHIRGDLAEGPTVGREALLLSSGLRSYVAVPLVAKGRSLGALCLASREPHQFATENAELLLELGGQVALAVDNMRAYEEIAELKARLQEESLYLREEIKLSQNFEEIIGGSEALRRTLEQVDAVAPTDSSVLILGETGTGKELIARALHDRSRRRDRALVKVNCAALPSGLVESELFGHERGAFTGATKLKKGRFELADGGTLFLDEIGDIPPDVQVKLLRALQEGEIERVGGTETIRVDVRVVAATNRNLARAVESGEFRSDLYYRLNVFPIDVPPLRERRGDIRLLTRFFVDKHAAKIGKQITSVSEQSLSRLEAHSWPGNVRELSSAIERAVIMAHGPELEIDVESLGSPKEALMGSDVSAKQPDSGESQRGAIEGEGASPQPSVTTKRSRIVSLREFERQHIQEALEMTGWRVSGERGAAKLLDIKPSTLTSRMRKLGIRRPDTAHDALED